MKLQIKNFILYLSLGTIGILFANLQAEAQSKAEIQQELDSFYNKPELFYKLKQELKAINQELAAKKPVLVQKKDELTAILRTTKKQDEAIESYEEQLRILLGQNPEVNATRQGRQDNKCSFSVQIGAYKNKDLTKYMESNPNFLIEEDANGFKKYLLGYFTSYWEALSFSKHLNANGAQSYVAGFLWGKRIPDLKDMTECIF